MIVALKILAVLGLVFLNGFFVASEFALVKVRETRLAELAAAGFFRARVARAVAAKLDAYLSATQLGITIASLALGWLGEPLVSEQLEPLLHRLGVQSTAAVSSISVAVGFAVITFLHIVFGELAPKSLAIRRSEDTALWIAIPLRLFYWVFFPVIWLLNAVAIFVLHLMGITPASEEELSHSGAELRMILSESARGGQISAGEQKISERALGFADLTARQVMVSRGEIVYFSLADSLEANLAKARARNCTRYPLCETDLDRVVGMVHIRDALWGMFADGKVDLAKVAREALFIGEDESLERALELFQSTHIHLALVVNEVGVVSGLLTLEDVLEQLVGAIQDEFDRESPWIRPLAGGGFEARGRTPLASLRRRLNLEFDGREVVTLSGYITQALGRFPKKGDVVTVGDWTFTVTRVDQLKVESTRIEKKG